MAKTFETLNGIDIEIVYGETEVDTNEDIITGKVSNYFVVVCDNKFEVNEKTYNAVQNYLHI